MCQKKKKKPRNFSRSLHEALVMQRDAHLAENRFVGLREELRQFFRVAEVQRQPVDAKTLGVQVLLLAQLVDVHPLHHQGAITLRNKKKKRLHIYIYCTAQRTWQPSKWLRERRRKNH